jgi:serine/threonine protein kinase
LGERITKGNISEEEMKNYFRGLICALEYCHECAEIIHRDIKPENILIDENDVVKLADFGVSYIMVDGNDEISTSAGSNVFFSPEACRGSKYSGKLNDIWAVGVTLYYMCTKEFPFMG